MCATAAMAQKPAELPLRIWQHNDTARVDTVYNSTFYLVGVTDPAASATIAGEKCHVYRTGSFGAEVTLQPGLNEIPVAVSADGGRAASRTVRIALASRPAENATATEQETPLDKPMRLVTKDGAYLQFGNGSDRLGGSKMGYLDDGIELTAVAQTRNLYRVKLGDNMAGYISKYDVETGGDGAPYVNTGNASIRADGKVDRLTISLPRRIPYWARTEIDPATLKVTLYGAMNNTNWLTQAGDLGMVEFVDVVQESAGVLTYVLRLKEKYAWGYSVHYSGSSLVVEVRHRPASLELKDLVIGLDAGHGGKYPGAISPSGLTEKEVNLDIVLEMARLLRKRGAKVVLTRDGDTGPSMVERKKTWRDAGVDLAVSVHNNASGNPLKPMGTSAYYKHIANRAFAQALHKSVLSLGVADFGLTGNFNFSLNAPTECPNALVEVLFMSSLPEEELLADHDYRCRLAAKIVDGIVDYLREVKKSL